MKILNVYSVGSSGKSSTLLFLIRNCIKSGKFIPKCQYLYYSEEEVSVEDILRDDFRSDIYGIYQFIDTGRYIAIGTAGDDVAHQNMLFDLYEKFSDKYLVDSIIVPSRTKGSTGSNIYDQAKKLGVSVLEYQKGHIYTDSLYIYNLKTDEQERIFNLINKHEAEMILLLSSREV